MVYLKRFDLLSDEEEFWISWNQNIRRLDNTAYPLHIFPLLELKTLFFSSITMIYGNNGSGKSTLLNIIASSLGATRKSAIDKGLYFDDYVRKCKKELNYESPVEIKIITSDDVFDYLLDIRSINAHVNREKDKLGREYIQNKYSINDANINDYERIKDICNSKKMTQSKYVRNHLTNLNIQEHSNGESALLFWEREIKDNSIYILDEPENSLSGENQLKLAKFIEESVRFYNCQFIISTHSPFFLSLNDATIYDLDSYPARERPWTELANVKLYYEFFKEHEKEFNELP